MQAEQKEGYFLDIISFHFLRRTKILYKKLRIPVYLFDKSRIQDIDKCRIIHEKS